MSTDPSANADLFGSGDAGAGVGEFVRSQLPTPPARVLEVGCGSGELALALSAEGWQVTAVDPEAPEGPPFVRAAVEDLDAADHGPFDAAVAVLSLHHAGVVGTVLDKVRSLLKPGGVLVVDEFRKEHLVDRATAAFLFHQQRSLIHAGRKGIDDGGHGGHGDRRSDGGSFESWYAHTLGAHTLGSHTLGSHTLGRRANIHGERDVLEALEERFVTRRLSYGPYLFRHGLDAAVEPLERMLIAEGGIRATGLRWVGALEAEPPG